jgi:hypothetical protein
MGARPPSGPQLPPSSSSRLLPPSPLPSPPSPPPPLSPSRVWPRMTAAAARAPGRRRRQSRAAARSEPLGAGGFGGGRVGSRTQMEPSRFGPRLPADLKCDGVSGASVTVRLWVGEGRWALGGAPLRTRRGAPVHTGARESAGRLGDVTSCAQERCGKRGRGQLGWAGALRVRRQKPPPSPAHEHAHAADPAPAPFEPRGGGGGRLRGREAAAAGPTVG